MVYVPEDLPQGPEAPDPIRSFLRNINNIQDSRALLREVASILYTSRPVLEMVEYAADQQEATFMKNMLD